jgi:peptide/nickel transport system permease protein
MPSTAKYLVRRLVLSLFSIFVVANILFFMFRLIPGNPATAMADPSLPKEVREGIISQYGLNKPLWEQYLLYFESLLQGSMGYSYHFKEPVTSLLIDRAINTIALMGSAIVLAFLIGPLIGAYLAWNRNELVDTYGIGAVLAMNAAPVFWTGMLAIMLFSFNLNWFPSGGMQSFGGQSTGMISRFLSLDFLYHLALPLLVTTAYYLSPPTLVMRNSMIDVLGSDFIEMKRAEGLPPLRVLYAHAARNSLLPVAHYAALSIGFAFGGSVIIEEVFSWPGAGRLLWTAVESQDYPLAQGAFLMLTVIIITMNFLVDSLSAYIDPRVADDEVSTQ